MAKVVGPIMSLDAKGKIKKTLVYQGFNGGVKVNKYSKPGSVNPFTPSASQLAQRAVIGARVAEWQALTAGQKAVWDQDAKDLGFHGTGYHLYMHRATVSGGGDTWTVQYEANELPEAATPAWEVTLYPDPLEGIREIVSSEYHYSCSGEEAEQVFYFTDPEQPVLTLQIKARVITGPTLASGDRGLFFSPLLFGSGVELHFCSDGVKVISWDPVHVQQEDQVNLDTLVDHVYRLTLVEGEFKLYVDGVLEASRSNLRTGEVPTPAALIWDDSLDVLINEHYIDYLYFRTDGAFAP
jgi:hypothetical protein